MTTKNTPNRIILKESYTLDLKELERMVKDFIKKYYEGKKTYKKQVKTEFGYVYRDYKPTITVSSVFRAFKRRNKTIYSSLAKIFRYLNQNYSSKHKLRDVYIFKLKYDGYTFREIAEITGLTIIRIKQIFYEIKSLIKR